MICFLGICCVPGVSRPRRMRYINNRNEPLFLAGRAHPDPPVCAQFGKAAIDR
jgi:hypothetical protein